MKNRFLLFSVALAAIVFSSCSNEDILMDENTQSNVTNPTTINDDFLEIKENIIEYGTWRSEQNDLTLDEYETSDNIKTRGFWSKLWGFAKGLFKSDAKGFINTSGGSKANIAQQTTRSGWGKTAGTLIELATANAVFSSIKYVVNVCTGEYTYNNNSGIFEAKKIMGIPTSISPVNPTDIALDSTIVFYDPKEKISQLDSAGYYHNAAIIDIFKTIPNIETLATMSDEEISQTVSRSVEHVFELPEGSFQCTLDTISVDSYSEYKGGGASSENTEQAEYENLMSVIETYLQNMYDTEGLEGDWVGYSKGVMTIISNSSLDSDTKDVLKAVFSVAFASSQLWNMEMLKEIINE